MEKAQQKRGESILYIFSAIEQSPRSADRQTPQRDRERQRWREREEERESLSVRLRGSMLRLMVLWYICVCVCVCMRGECGELPWPWPGAPLSKVFVVELTRGGSFLVGTRLPVSAQTVPAWTRPVESGVFRTFGFAFFLQLHSGLQKTQIWGRGEKENKNVTTTERTAESALNARWKPCCVLVAYTPAPEWSARCVCVYKIYSVCGHACACVSWFPLSAC